MTADLPRMAEHYPELLFGSDPVTGCEAFEEPSAVVILYATLALYSPLFLQDCRAEPRRWCTGTRGRQQR